MPTTKSSWGVAIKYAIITAIASFIFQIIMYATGTFTNKWLPYLGFVILIAGMVYAIKDRRDKELGGNISYGQAFGVGFQFCLILGLFSAILSYILFNFIAPDMVETILRQTETDMINRGMSDDQVKMGMEWTRKIVSPVGMVITSLISTLFFGAIISLIVAAIMKKENPMIPPGGMNPSDTYNPGT